MELLWALVVLAIAVVLVQYIVGMLALPPQIKTLVFIVIAIIALIYLANLFGFGPGLQTVPYDPGFDG